MMRSKIPLAQRLQSAAHGRKGLPWALGIYDLDFYREIGEMTHQEERYQSVYEEHIKPYGSPDGSMKCLYDLVTEADELEEADRQDLLFWLLVEPFATIHTQQNNKERKNVQ